jgi:2',3'-cyclic-nucleotide 2'-phosphodiesterase (5'-nucleotidase family)
MSDLSHRSEARPQRIMALAALIASSCAHGPAATPVPAATTSPDRTAVIMAINDVYRIEGVNGGSVGGLARVRALRLELEKQSPDLLLLHGGDFLFPSFASRMFRGEQMIAAMNVLDGDAQAFDPRMFVVFGNHEFERPRLRDAAFLDERIERSQFGWLGANVSFVNGPGGEPLIAAKNLGGTALVESGGIRVGIFGVTIPTVGVEYIADIAGEQATARARTAELRARGAEVVVALTHLNAGNDRALLEALGDAGPDLLIGGHDHEAVVREVKGRWLLKADADARTATVVRMTKRGDGSLVVKPELRRLQGDSPRPDPFTLEVVNEWQTRHARAFCAEAKAGETCLDEVYGRTRSELGAEENKIRGRETTLGNWIADAAVSAFRSCGAQVAFLNAGSLRLNRDLPAQSVITRRDIEELIAYQTPLHLVKIDGATLVKVAEQAARGWPGSGSWLQISGFAFRHDTTVRAASDVTWLLEGGPRPVGPADQVLAVVGDYLVNPQIGDQDGYQMLNRDQIVTDCPIEGLDLKTLVIRALRAEEPAGIAPRIEGRICQASGGRPPCLIPSR